MNDVWQIPAVSEDDDLWERLGRGPELGESEQWIRIDGMLPEARVYFRREITESGPTKITGIVIDTDAGITAEMLRSIPMVRLENFDQAFIEGLSADHLEPLRREDYDDPEEFAQAVAFSYRVFAASSSTPTKDLAEHSSVPLSTARSWIREARLRGQLPPGRRGKAG